MVTAIYDAAHRKMPTHPPGSNVRHSPAGEFVVGLKRRKSSQDTIKATVNGFLRDAIRDIDVALVSLRGEDLGPGMKAQREELQAIKLRLQSIIDQPSDGSSSGDK
jgi:hypothetical protein